MKESLQPSLQRPTVTKDELGNLRADIQSQFGWTDTLHTFQYEAIVAQLMQKDVLVHAGTGSGKTAIAAGPHIHKKAEGMVTFMISPLIALQNEQVSGKSLDD